MGESAKVVPHHQVGASDECTAPTSNRSNSSGHSTRTPPMQQPSPTSPHQEMKFAAESLSRTKVKVRSKASGEETRSRKSRSGRDRHERRVSRSLSADGEKRQRRRGSTGSQGERTPRSNKERLAGRRGHTRERSRSHDKSRKSTSSRPSGSSSGHVGSPKFDRIKRPVNRRGVSTGDVDKHNASTGDMADLEDNPPPRRELTRIQSVPIPTVADDPPPADGNHKELTLEEILGWTPPPSRSPKKKERRPRQSSTKGRGPSLDDHLPPPPPEEEGDDDGNTFATPIVTEIKGNKKNSLTFLSPQVQPKQAFPATHDPLVSPTMKRMNRKVGTERWKQDETMRSTRSNPPLVTNEESASDLQFTATFSVHEPKPIPTASNNTVERIMGDFSAGGRDFESWFDSDESGKKSTDGAKDSAENEGSGSDPATSKRTSDVTPKRPTRRPLSKSSLGSSEHGIDGIDAADDVPGPPILQTSPPTEAKKSYSISIGGKTKSPRFQIKSPTGMVKRPSGMEEPDVVDNDDDDDEIETEDLKDEDVPETTRVRRPSQGEEIFAAAMNLEEEGPVLGPQPNPEVASASDIGGERRFPWKSRKKEAPVTDKTKRMSLFGAAKNRMSTFLNRNEPPLTASAGAHIWGQLDDASCSVGLLSEEELSSGDNKEDDDGNGGAKYQVDVTLSDDDEELYADDSGDDQDNPGDGQDGSRSYGSDDENDGADEPINPTTPPASPHNHRRRDRSSPSSPSGSPKSASGNRRRSLGRRSGSEGRLTRSGSDRRLTRRSSVKGGRSPRARHPKSSDKDRRDPKSSDKDRRERDSKSRRRPSEPSGSSSRRTNRSRNSSGSGAANPRSDGDMALKDEEGDRQKHSPGSGHRSGRSNRSGQSGSPHSLQGGSGRSRRSPRNRSTSPGTYRGDLARRREAMQKMRAQKSLQQLPYGDEEGEVGKKSDEMDNSQSVRTASGRTLGRRALSARQRSSRSMGSENVSATYQSYGDFGDNDDDEDPPEDESLQDLVAKARERKKKGHESKSVAIEEGLKPEEKLRKEGLEW